MSHKTGFFSLNRRILLFGILLSGCLLLFFGMFSRGNHYLFEQQNRLLDVQQQYSAVVDGLNRADSHLYTYAQARSGETRAKCEKILQELDSASEGLSKLLEQPIFVDLEYLVDAYVEEAQKLLAAETIGAGQALILYQESVASLKLITPLISQYSMEVANDRMEWQQKLERTQKNIETTMIFSAAAMLAVCIGFLLSFSRHITHNLVSLTKRAEKICEGEWNVEMPDRPQSRDEVGVLTKAFYRMLEVIQDQIEQLKRQEAMERQLKEAELRAVNMKAKLEHEQLRTLQSRVNPHFLFNALNVIGGQAAEESAEKTLDMILKTADYLRYSLSNLDKTVTLSQELENVEDYFIIQKRRFGERMKFAVQCDEDCEKVKIPAMVLQPLCENALRHGVMPLTQGGEINVSAKRLQQRIFVTVQDNGLGFSEERLEEIRQRLKSEEYDDTQGIGLHNIVQRMNAFFHGEVECEIQSIPKRETCVILSFPAKEMIENANKEREDGDNDKSDFGG